MKGDRLFGHVHDARLDHYLAHARSMLDERIQGMPEDDLLAADEQELAETLAAQSHFEPLTVDFDARTADGNPRQVTVYEPGPLDPENEYPRDATETTIVIPFSGDGVLFRFCPGTTLPNMFPHGTILGQTIRSKFTIKGANADEMKRQIEFNEGLVKNFVDWMRPEVDAHNESLVPSALTAIRDRKKRILGGRGMVASLKIPIRAREGAPATYAPPVRKRAMPQPSAPKEPFKPQHELDRAVFDGIVEVVKTMGHALERSPSTFARLGEEDLRNFILVLLNSHYETGATAETFNNEGKTDILIRSEGRNVFIAECKKWSGPKTVADALDQLLGYLCWRDTKAALILFSDRKDFSEVVTRVKEEVPRHPCHVRTEEPKGDTDFRYVFSHPGDSAERIRLAVLVFNVPA